MLPAVAVALLYVAWELIPTFLSLLWTRLPWAVRQHIVVGSLEALLIAYVLVLLVLVVGILTVVVMLARSGSGLRRRPWLARLLLLDFSLFVGVLGIEAVSWGWTRWLHRAPALPAPSGSNEVTLRLPDPPSGGGTSKPGEPLRILVIGESSARGEPYHPWLSIGQIVGWQLEKVFPGRPVQVDMQADGGLTLEQVHQKLAGITYRPDVLFLFSGHNEFQGRWNWARNPPYYVDEMKPALSRWSLLCGFLPCVG